MITRHLFGKHCLKYIKNSLREILLTLCIRVVDVTNHATQLDNWLPQTEALNSMGKCDCNWQPYISLLIFCSEWVAFEEISMRIMLLAIPSLSVDSLAYLPTET